jgi:hypothetical protein
MLNDKIEEKISWKLKKKVIINVFLGLKCILPWPLSVHYYNEILGGFSILIGFGYRFAASRIKNI